MYDTSGIGWNAHMGFGTSVLLQLMSPASFQSPQSIAIYREIRLFEISRATVFSQDTILATPEWLLYDQKCCNASRSFIEKAFDLLLRCQIFGQR